MKKKLVLHRETVKNLASLGSVGGGAITLDLNCDIVKSGNYCPGGGGGGGSATNLTDCNACTSYI